MLTSRTALVDAPDDQALATAAVACGKDAIDRSRVLARRRLDVGPRVLLQAELLDARLLGAKEAERKKAELARAVDKAGQPTVAA